jgi:A/G-specific adenine glycosylase
VPPGRTATALLAWFDRVRRPLPWRANRDPYRVWVAEVLLQQTRVDQAAPYFERFVVRFPTVRALARAPLREVLKVWEGAGYYARARHLHQAARSLLRDSSGVLPARVEELERLPGVGRYTARAVASLAYGAPVVALEANGLRVAARWLCERGDLRSASVRRRLEAALGAILPSDRAGAFNEAVMELGETVCLPRHPRCLECPVAFGCRARRELPDPGRLPSPRPRPTRPHVRGAVVVLEQKGRWLVQRRPEPGLLGGLWEFPGGRIEPGERPEAAARRELAEETGAGAGRLTPMGVVRHAYSHFTVELHVFRGAPSGPRARLGRTRRWATPEAFARLPRPRATEKIVRRLQGGVSVQSPRRGSAAARTARGSGPTTTGSPGARRPRRRARAPTG